MCIVQLCCGDFLMLFQNNLFYIVINQFSNLPENLHHMCIFFLRLGIVHIAPWFCLGNEGRMCSKGMGVYQWVSHTVWCRVPCCHLS